MRPPEFTGGNPGPVPEPTPPDRRGFNEAAGIHRRKRSESSSHRRCLLGFNEAAGIHRRKPRALIRRAGENIPASMRPPEFTGGNGPQLTPGDSYSC